MGQPHLFNIYRQNAYFKLFAIINSLISNNYQIMKLWIILINSCILYSGLDIVAIKNMVNLLRMLAGQGRTIICTIHQPTASLLSFFNRLYVVADGYCVYQGSPSRLVPFMSNVNLQCPITHNPADFGKLEKIDYSWNSCYHFQLFYFMAFLQYKLNIGNFVTACLKSY